MRHRLVFLLLFPLAASAWADEPLEELPPPKPDQSVLVSREPAQRGYQAASWGLIGPRGRLYCAGGVALADYVQLGQRHIVTLEPESSARHTPPNENFLYFRETLAGHRWAIARYPSADQRFRVYFQSAGSSGEWQFFQWADVTWQPQQTLEPTIFWIWPEPVCEACLLGETFSLWP
jgi:hypothetical protein